MATRVSKNEVHVESQVVGWVTFSRVLADAEPVDIKFREKRKGGETLVVGGGCGGMGGGGIIAYRASVSNRVL